METIIKKKKKYPPKSPKCNCGEIGHYMSLHKAKKMKSKGKEMALGTKPIGKLKDQNEHIITKL